MIDRFDGEYAFLSNFFEGPLPVVLKGRAFRTAEHAYQACKFADPAQQHAIQIAETPGQAKRLGTTFQPLRPGWDDMKIRVMTAVIQAKFAPTTELAHKLMLTGDQQLVEGNTWGDRFWGCVLEPGPKEGTWVGRNELGRILMEHRRALQHDIPFGPVGS